MSIDVKVNGTVAKEGILIAPVGGTSFPASISIGSGSATLRVQTAVKVELSQTTLKAGETATLTALEASKQKGDITLQVEVYGKIEATVSFTAVANPRIRFMGRYEVRFATNMDFYNEPRGTDQGWTWALEGEPDFVPKTDNIPLKPGQPVGRVLRFHDPVALRTHVAPIGVFVTQIEGDTESGTVDCPAGDPVIGEKVSLGPNTYYASNFPNNPAEQEPFEQWPDGQEPFDCFEVHVGTRLSGGSKELTDRPQAHGFKPLPQKELQAYGIIPLKQFSEQRRLVLLDDYRALSPADRTGTPAGRNLAKRIAHLGGSQEFGIPTLTPTLSVGWIGREIYDGVVNADLKIDAGDSPVLRFFAAHEALSFSAKFFNFHSDELCARVDGTLSVLTQELLHRTPEPPLPLAL
ncbi:MAG TPA: hypothetical protein VJ276_07215 [Thermoanaerobaculia bacterium]|nr:hypothetical protein [Thermoanaerobaculia bacterium]